MFMTPHPRFQDKRALVTGATRGLGRIIAEWLARDGAHVYVTGREQEDVDQAVQELGTFGTTIQGSTADLANLEEIHRLARTAMETAGPFDYLINNAGFSIPQSFLDVSDDDWDEEITTNLRAPFILSQHIARAMIEHDLRGRIVNISSIGAFAAHSEKMVYDIAKAAVMGMTQNMGVELGPYGITVNCVAPGAVPHRPGSDEHHPPDFDRIPLGRLGTADDIANAVCFFCQDESEWITGQTLLVDGGNVSRNLEPE
jgi:NAD(P)-dependent dehydrogenase (short-subunit alcohol dehydrogenase family)